MKYLSLLLLVIFTCPSAIALEAIFGYQPPIDQSKWNKACIIDNQLFVVLSGSTNALFRYDRPEGDVTMYYYDSKWNANAIRDLHCLNDTIIIMDDQTIKLYDTELEQIISYNVTTYQAKMAIIDNRILIRDKYQLIMLSFNTTSANITLLEYLTPLDIPWLGTTDFPSICCGYQFCWLNDNYTLYRYSPSTSSLVNYTLDQGYHVALVCQDDFLWVAYNLTIENYSASWIAYTTLSIDSNTYVNYQSFRQNNTNIVPKPFMTLTGFYYNPIVLYDFGVMLWPNPAGVLITQLFPDIVDNEQNQLWETDDTPLQIVYLGDDLSESDQNIYAAVLDRNDFIIVISSDSFIGYLASEFVLEYVRWFNGLIAQQEKTLGIIALSIMSTAYFCAWIIILSGILCVPLLKCIIDIEQLLHSITVRV